MKLFFAVKPGVAVLLIVFFIFEARTESVQGIVKDSWGYAAKGIIVTLKNAAFSDTTDYNGNFILYYEKPETAVKPHKNTRADPVSGTCEENYLLNGRKFKDIEKPNMFQQGDRWAATNRIISAKANVVKYPKQKDQISRLRTQSGELPIDSLCLHGKFYKEREVPFFYGDDDLEIIVEFDNPPGKNAAITVEPFPCLERENISLVYGLNITGEGFLKKNFHAVSDSIIWIHVPPGTDRLFSFDFTEETGNYIGRHERYMDIEDSGICIVDVDINVSITLDMVQPVHGSYYVSLNGSLESTILPLQLTYTILDQDNNSVSEQTINFMHNVLPADKYKIDFKKDLNLTMAVSQNACNGRYQLQLTGGPAACLVTVKTPVDIDGVKNCE